MIPVVVVEPDTVLLVRLEPDFVVVVTCEVVLVRPRLEVVVI